MSFRCGVFIFLCISFLITPLCFAQTGRDLRPRIAIDGLVDEYTLDEWVLDAGTSVPEPPGDSRWGLDNDIRRIAVTWDVYNLYVAIECTVANTAVLLCVDCGCGGFAGLQDVPLLERNIVFRDCTPNVIVHAGRSLDRPQALSADCAHAPRILFEDEYRALLYQGKFPDGALEVAIPWELFPEFRVMGDEIVVPAAGYSLRLLAAISGGEATGAGDAAPNTTLLLDNDSTSVALLDNHIIIPLDADGNGTLDIGAAPRQAARFAQERQTHIGTIPDMAVTVDKKAFAPDEGEQVKFRAIFKTGTAAPVAVTAGVYSVSGSLVRVLFAERSVTPGRDFMTAWEEWDGRDADGAIVAGGIYIIAVSAGTGGAGVKHIAKEAVAVIR